jgi:hypothetical protein
VDIASRKQGRMTAFLEVLRAARPGIRKLMEKIIREASELG